MELTRVLLTNYLPYAKSTIIDRAIVSIDGLKPAQRRVLYTMNKLGLGNKDKPRSKCSKIVGATMSVHPHGDSSIYEALVNMSVGHEGLNIGYIDSKGNFGKVYSKVGYAAARYTEARLAPICAEMFDGIKEDAVDFVDNFDGTEKEPTLLPTRFPNVLVNTTAGVAVGTSSYIPSFALNNVCDATIGILKGTIKTNRELAEVLGVPEFTTGGHLHATVDDIEKLCETGKGSFALSGSVVAYPNKIVITEIPYNTTAEDIIKSVTDYAKSGELREVADIHDDTGLAGFKMTVELKNRINSREVVQKLARLTPLRTKISFRTRIIVNNRCKEMGLFELLTTWIDFRDTTLTRIYTFRKSEAEKQEHLLSTWEKVLGHIVEVVDIMSKHTEAEAKTILKLRFKLDDDQCEYLLDFRLRQITEDRAKKSLQKLAETRAELVNIKNILANKSERVKIILADLEDIKAKYGKESKTLQAEPIVESTDKIEKAPISDEAVRVVLTKKGYIKRLTTIREMTSFVEPEDDPLVGSWGVKNNEYILVFTYNGTVHKVLVDSIDASKTFREQLFQKLNLASPNEIMYVDKAGDFTGHFNIVYPNGRGMKVGYDKAKGPRSKYVSLYEQVAPGAVFITKEDKFFIITKRLKAAYADISEVGVFKTRMAFKVARISSGDRILGILNDSCIPARQIVDFSKYSKDYTVCIGNDIIWRQPSDVKTGTLCYQADDLAEQLIKKALED